MDIDKNTCKVKKDPSKIVGGVAFLHSQDTQCQYALVEVEPKNDYFQTAKKVSKINLRITAKPHAHIQTLTKTPAKFQKDWLKL